MKEAIRKRLNGFINTVIRYPAAAVFLVLTAGLTAAGVGGCRGLTRYILTCGIGAAAGAAAQSAFERFFVRRRWRFALYLLSLLAAGAFYLTIRRVSEASTEMELRTAVSIFTLWVAFIWLAVAGSRFSFAESFMASFKALFQAGFFSGVLYLGCAAVAAAVDRLITPVSSQVYSHIANIVFVLFAPLLFLSLIPEYSAAFGDGGGAPATMLELIEKRTACPRFLEVLLSYIVIPLIAVFTVVLLVYIVLNIGGKFWTNNLLEPLLIAYSVAVLTVTLLACRLENRFAVLFRTIFPKVLIPIALFQAIASLLLMSDTGVTYMRYYVILYGLFAVIAGFELSTLPLRRWGTIAAVLIAMSSISLAPPTDAFTVSRFSQIRSMEHILKINGMLADQRVQPNNALPAADKTRIISAVRYLGEMDELGRVKWLPAGFNPYDDIQFYGVFGFHMYEPAEPQYPYISVTYDLSGLIGISGYDTFTQVSLPPPDKTPAQGGPPLTGGGSPYTVSLDGSPGAFFITVKDGSGGVRLRFDTEEIFKRYANYPASKNALTKEEAVFTKASDGVKIEIVVMNAGFNTAPGSTELNAQLLVFAGLAQDAAGDQTAAP